MAIQAPQPAANSTEAVVVLTTTELWIQLIVVYGLISGFDPTHTMRPPRRISSLRFKYYLGANFKNVRKFQYYKSEISRFLGR